LEARVFLHEFDHLIGVTFDQRVGEVSLNLAQNKRKKELKKKKKSKASA
jgi:peptide deformylase